MTQQLDLAFNTTNSMENLMNSTKFSSKETKSDAGFETQFSNYLDDANKNLKSNEKHNSNVSKNNKESLNSDKNYKSEEKVSYSDNKNVSEDKKTTEYYDENDLSKENLNIKNDVADSKTVEISDDIKLSDVKEELNEQEMDELLKDSMLNAALLNSQVVSGDENVKLDSGIVQEPVKFLAESINSGILFEDTTSATVEDLSNVDVKAVDEVLGDISASKDEYISAMYADKKDVDLKTENLNVSQSEKTPILNAELKADLKAEDVKVEDTKVEKVKTDVIRVEDVKDVKVVKNIPQVEENSEDLKNVSEDENKISLLKSDVKETVESSTDEELTVEGSEKDNNTQLNINNKAENDNLKTQIVADDKTEAKDINPKMVSEVITEKEVEVVVQPEVNEQTNFTKISADVKSEPAKDKMVFDKNEKLNEEISSAKLENAANISEKTEKIDKTEKNIPDENAKTNVVADETMEIKEDVKGIEFKSQPKTEISEEKTVLDNKVAQKVENVKIQVEENIKIPNVQQNSTDAAKIAKANETLEQAGLSTENLKKIDGKIKDIDYSSNQNPQTDLGQSSQEMMFREMLQNSAENSSQSPVLSKIDFNQTLQKAHNSLNQTQMPQDTQEIDILEQIRTRLNVSNKGGMQKITIGLTPESLGKLNIEISRSQNGISAQILADNPQAKEILDKNLDGLKSVLQSQGVNVNNVNVKVAEASRSSDSDNNMFQKDDNEFGSNNKEGNSRNSENSNREKRSEFEFIQNTVLTKDSSDDVEDTITRTSQLEKTVSINGGLGKVNYKM